MSLENPNWSDYHDREMFDKLFYHDIGRELTDIEKKFCRDMYYYEECAAGLDGADIQEQE